MEYLPAEIQLKILKNLNFDELFKLKLTNKYFCYFINKYEDELARKKFDELSFTAIDYKKLKLKLIDFPLSNHLQEKWQSAVDKQIKIPLYLDIEAINIFGEYPFCKCRTLLFHPEENSQEKDLFSLKLPIYPENIEELKIVRYWLNQISRCDFRYLNFGEIIFNPEIIKLIFDNDEIAKFKLNCKDAIFFFLYRNTFTWKFTFEHLISEYLQIYFSCKQGITTTEEASNFLLLSNTGDGTRIVTLCELGNNNLEFYNLLINHLETSTGLSKINKITFICCGGWPRSKLIVRGSEMNESNNKKKCYKITNIHNPKMIILIEWYFYGYENDLVGQIKMSAQ